MNRDEYFMDFALKEAKKAYKKGEVPVGCVIVKKRTQSSFKQKKWSVSRRNYCN